MSNIEPALIRATNLTAQGFIERAIKGGYVEGEELEFEKANDYIVSWVDSSKHCTQVLFPRYASDLKVWKVAYKKDWQQKFHHFQHCLIEETLAKCKHGFKRLSVICWCHCFYNKDKEQRDLLAQETTNDI